MIHDTIFLSVANNFLRHVVFLLPMKSLEELLLNDNRIEKFDGHGLIALRILRLQNNLFSFDSDIDGKQK